MADNYRFGRSKEHKVARSLRSRGAKVKTSPGSKGAADLRATFPSGTKWNVQVKASRGSNPPQPSPRDLGRLKQSSTKGRSTPVLATVTPKGITYKSARSGRTLSPPKKK